MGGNRRPKQEGIGRVGNSRLPADLLGCHGCDKLDECVEVFRHRSPDATVGLVALENGRILGADVFADARLCRELWEKLVRAHALDLIAPGTGERRSYLRRPPDIRAYLDRAARSVLVRCVTPGAGELYQLSGAAPGQALVLDGVCVHAGLFDGAAPTPYPLPHRR